MNRDATDDRVDDDANDADVDILFSFSFIPFSFSVIAK